MLVEKVKSLLLPKGPKRYRGRLLYAQEDEFGIIEVIQSSGHLSLHFGRSERQSAIDPKNPRWLVLHYTKAMMISLLFEPDPQKVLFVGLGGGSMPNFMHRHFPQCSIQVVELRQSVHQVAKEYFSFPEHPQLQVQIQDARDFVAQCQESYQMIFVDIYDARGMSQVLRDKESLERLKAMLQPGGFLVMNLWSQETEKYHGVLYYLYDIFNEEILHLPITDKTNHIVFAFQDGVPPLSASHLEQAVLDWTRRYHMGTHQFYQRLLLNNPSRFRP